VAFPGIWMTQNEWILYRVVPKAAYSSIGQILFYSEHGAFFECDIHDAQAGIHKWALEHSRSAIISAVKNPDVFRFSYVRNPYHKILSSFFDKICGVQRSGGRYRETLVPFLVESYGIDVGGENGKQEFDQIRAFRRFLLFVRDTVHWGCPMAADIHWSPMSDHLATLVTNGRHYNQIFRVEPFNPGMRQVLDAVETPHAVDLTTVSKLNGSEVHGPKRAHPVADYFDDLSMNLMYKRNFYLFKYDFLEPANQMPMADLDLAYSAVVGAGGFAVELQTR
jgi:hypothetical protein